MEITVDDILRQFVYTKEDYTKEYLEDYQLRWIDLFKYAYQLWALPKEDIGLRFNWFNFRYEYDYLRRYRDGSCEKERRFYQSLCKEVGRYKKETGTCEQIFKIGEREFRYKPQNLHSNNEQSSYVSSKTRTESAINSIYGVVANRRHGDL